MGVLDWLMGSQSLILETCLVGALFFVLIYLLNALRTGWKQYAAFRTVPTDPDQHFLFGHTPRVRKVSAALVVSLQPTSPAVLQNNCML